VRSTASWTIWVQLVAGAAPARIRFPQHAARQQVVDVAQCRVRRALGYGSPLAAGELAFEPVEQPVEQLHLTLVQGGGRPMLPETCLGQYGIERVLRLIDGAMERVEKPGEPLGDVHRPLLGPLQDVVVGLAFALDLRRQAVEALRATVGARQQQVADGPSDTPVAVVERVQGDEPQVTKASLEQRRFA